jgi:hypothetical protein
MSHPHPTHLLRIALVAAGLSTLLGCIEDDGEGGPTLPVSDACPTDCGALSCYLRDGVPSCLEANCGSDRCADGATCVGGTCEFVDTPTCAPSCGAGTHCVYGNCIPDYASSGCDPLRVCRKLCGSDLVCLAACEDDQSASCTALLDDLADCERSNECDSGPYASCCATDFRRTFPQSPAFSDTPCRECVEVFCGTETSCLNDCFNDEQACSGCLRDTCGGTGDVCDQGYSTCTGL